MTHQRLGITTPIERVPALGDAHIACTQFRRVIASPKIGGSILAQYATTPEALDTIDSLQKMATIFADCYTDVDTLKDKYDGIELGSDFEGPWLDFGQLLIDDLTQIYQEYTATPEGRRSLVELFSIYPDYRRAKYNSVRGTTKSNRYEKMHSDLRGNLFDIGIKEGARTALAYYEVAQHIAGNGRYPIGLVGPVRRLILSHSGVSPETNDQLLAQLRRTDGAAYDNLLFNPDCFEVSHRTGRTELVTKYGLIKLDSIQDGVPTGCPAYGYGTIGKLCSVIESVVVPKSERTHPRPLGALASRLAVVDDRVSDVLIPDEFKHVYQSAKGGATYCPADPV